ncbi:SDHC, cytochrome b subunit of succinate dehydrogenase [Obba rivulosa]|uniref:SDHC, cytochrome b subunit of succinate dehydrogenase n=1 Tax=Obba rivulosa TaxID=1052685 RepID=A0A8E2B1Q8_9APHY|nr:SDHC, cytochrome b subunit of succinate dehydrogenase [Obba rivulosa]
MIVARTVGLGAALRRSALVSQTGRPLALRNVLSKRSIQTQSLPPSAEEQILNSQRLKRPSSPHFTIYQPQLTWIASIANRVTGVGLSVLLYGYALAYLVAPGTFDSAHVIEFVAGLPDAVKYAGKTILAAPFAFHSWNGLRHLSWDMGKFLSLKGAYQTGYAVLGLTAVTTVGLVMM